ncbi:MOSC domain-containing protein [Rhodobacter sp.]
MPIALKPTDFTARVVWLGTQVIPVEKLVITSEPVTEMPLTFAGYARESHGGETRPSCSRVLAQHPRNTTIRNTRQLSVVSAEEMAGVAAELGLVQEWDHAWVGASLVLEGIPDFTHIPPSSRLQGPDGVTLVVDMINHPCQEPAVTIAKATGGRGKAFKTAAKDRRGVTAWVEREGVLRLGDVVRLHVPDQRAWTHLNDARAIAAE